MDENKMYDEQSEETVENNEPIQQEEVVAPAEEPVAEAVNEEPVAEPVNEESAAEPVNEEPVSKPAKKKINFKRLIIGAAAVVVAAVVALIVFNSPRFVFAASIKGAVKGILGRQEIAPVVSMLKHGSLDANGSYELTEDETMTFAAKMFFSKKHIYVSDMSLKADDVNIDGSLYFGLDYMYVQSDKLLDGAYGVTAGGSEDAFKNSIFAGKGEYALPEDAQTMIANYLRGYDEGIYTKMSKDLNKLLKKYENKVYDLICKHGEFESKNTTIRVDGERVKVREITLVISPDAAVKIAEDLFEFVEKDKKLESFFIDYVDFFSEALEATGSIDDDFDAQEAYDDFLEMFEDAIDEFSEIVDDSDDEDIEIVAAVAAGTSKLVRFSIESDGYTMIEVEFGKKGAKKSNKISITSNESNSYIYEVKKNSLTEFKASLVHEYEDYWDDETVEYEIFSIDINKSRGSIKVSADEGYYVVKGSFKSGLLKTEIGIDSITVGDSKNKDFTINVTIKKFDFINGQLKKDDYATIDDITGKKIEEIIENIENIGSSN